MTSERLKLTSHARQQAVRRAVPVEDLLEVARHPDQIVHIRPGREVRQSRRTLSPGGKEYLIRVIVDVVPGESRVITVYRTSKLSKYWRRR